MKEKIQWKSLAVFLLTAVVFGLLSRLFMAEADPGWIPTVAAVAIAFILYPVVSVVLLKDNKKRYHISRFILLGLVLLSAWFYYNAWNKSVCTVKELWRDGTVNKYRKKNIIIGNELIEAGDTALQRLVSKKQFNAVFEYYNSYNPSDIWTTDSIDASRRKLNNSLVLLTVIVSLLGMHTVESLLIRRQRRNEPLDQVFISYNHENKQQAVRLAELLRANDITVIRDEDNMPAGEDINLFIKNSIRTSAITLMIVSEKSLLSGWVATEAATSFFLSDYDETRGCIACYVDAAFREPGFGTSAIIQVNAKLETIEKDIKERDKLHADSKDLNDQKTRLYTLKNNMDTILQRLQNSKCVDIAGDKLEQNFPVVLEAIKNKFKGNDETT